MLPVNKWVKASRSGGNNSGPNCVQCLQFVKATKGDNSGANCVEQSVATDGLHEHCGPGECLAEGIQAGDVVVRDSKAGPGSPVAVFTPMLWEQFVAAVADGQEWRDGEDWTIVDPRGTGVVLRFNAGEWDAFRDGCGKGEFALADTRAVQEVTEPGIMTGVARY